MDTVRYSSPAHGGWGVVRMGMLVPESHQLFVCPFACGRHGAIGAITQGLKDRLSYLYIDEADIVSGGYEQLICEGVEELLGELEVNPKALLIFVSCLDDLLGTDHEAFLQVLRERHPDMRFVVCHMNPISLDSKVPPPVNIQRKMYGLLEPSARPKRKEAAALYGINVGVDQNSEIYQVLAAVGFTDVRHMTECATFSEFQKLAEVSLNIVLSPVGLAAAADSRKRLGIPYAYLPLSYDFTEIERNYTQLLPAAGASPVWEGGKQSALRSISAARTEIGDLPLVVDASATIRPFTLARLLCSSGFKVREIYAQQCIELEKESCRWIGENVPELQIRQPEHPRAPVIRKHDRECLAIGFEGAYLTGARYVANLVNDETLYGYQGIEKLMKQLVSAYQTGTDLRSLINQYNLVV